MIILDTHAAFEDMVASGLPKEQAESIVRVLKKSNNDLATKQDIELVKRDIETVRSELKHEIELVKKDLSAISTMNKLILGAIITLVISSPGAYNVFQKVHGIFV